VYKLLCFEHTAGKLSTNKTVSTKPSCPALRRAHLSLHCLSFHHARLASRVHLSHVRPVGRNHSLCVHVERGRWSVGLPGN
jgi:hypothetical protein